MLDAELFSEWLKLKDIKQFTLRHVLRAGPNQLRNKPRLEKAISELLNNGYLFENEAGHIIDNKAAKKSWSVIHYVV
ncbi:MAG: hypothetical protein GY954_10200 [Alteromonas sp.]|nr:hypothetical protein [Alteromonas sp.]